MKKRAFESEEVHKDVLIKSKEQFKKELDERLEIGQELLTRQIRNPDELKQSEDDFRSWDDYNNELLKRSFDRPNNDYHRDYSYTSIGIHFLGGPLPSFREELSDHKTDIKRQFDSLKLIRGKVDLIDTIVVHTEQEVVKESDQSVALEILKNLFAKFHRIAQTLRIRYKDRSTLIIEDEYDVQDLLRALLKEHFNDIRDEEYTPSYAGANSRIDFLLKNEKLVIETKMTNEKLKDKEIGGQLLIDIGRYRSHPDCKLLVLFIYDRGDFIKNKGGLIRDLNQMSSPALTVVTFINPE